MPNTVFKNVEPVERSKPILNKMIEVKDYEGEEEAWRIVKEFVWEYQMPLHTELRIMEKVEVKINSIPIDFNVVARA